MAKNSSNKIKKKTYKKKSRFRRNKSRVRKKKTRVRRKKSARTKRNITKRLKKRDIRKFRAGATKMARETATVAGSGPEPEPEPAPAAPTRPAVDRLANLASRCGNALKFLKMSPMTAGSLLGMLGTH